MIKYILKYRMVFFYYLININKIFNNQNDRISIRTRFLCKEYATTTKN